MQRSSSELDLPGFRFHPTEEELLDFYLSGVVYGKKKFSFDIIGTLNIYRHDPWELPKLAHIGEREWYFFVPRDRKQSINGGRPSRTTERGFWKATGSDRPIRSSTDPKRLIGLKKTLVFYKGRAPRGSKTDWIMNEYRLPELSSSNPLMKDIVLCKVYRKATSLKALEKRAALEEETRVSQGCTSSSSSSEQMNVQHSVTCDVMAVKEEAPRDVEISSGSLRSVSLAELQIPMHNLEWMQDSTLTQLRSPWLEHWSPYYANILNF